MGWRIKGYLRIPKEFSIKGKTWTVKSIRHLARDNNNNGECHYEAREIHLEWQLSHKKKVQVFLHEMIHAILYEAHVTDGLDSQLEEIICDAISDVFEDKFKFEWKNIV